MPRAESEARQKYQGLGGFDPAGQRAGQLEEGGGDSSSALHWPHGENLFDRDFEFCDMLGST